MSGTLNVGLEQVGVRHYHFARMSYETVETRVDRLEALFGHFLTQMALIEKRAAELER